MQPTTDRRDRCPACGSPVLPSLADFYDSHPAPHKPRGRFNPRCALCWADVSAALTRALGIVARRFVAKLGPQAEP